MSDNTIVHKNNPLGTEPIGKLLLSFSVPSITACLVNSVYNIVDQIFIGQGVGYLGNAATTVSFPMMTIVLEAVPTQQSSWEKRMTGKPT